MSSPFTFADARRIVRDHLLNSWTAANGRLQIAENGYESPTHWRVLAESAPVADDEDDQTVEDPLPARAYLVSKESGQIETVAETDPRLGSMAPYGQFPSG